MEDLASISKDASSVLINSVPFFDYSMPLSHQFSNIGGITVDKNAEYLDPYWKSIADDAKDGFVLVSFGGIARTVDMTPAMQRIFFDSFSRFPHITFIAKYESTNTT
uniref:glucuronosyltransferase n=1 Tax=Caenorhabditis japonica TaxID=281687 RepID=A0A8R1IQI5_CAEJA